jgi:two-component system response regulator MprA
MILLVDDHTTTLRLLTLAFESAGWKTSSYDHPAEALTHLLEDQPSVVVLDLEMPQIDGEEFHRRARLAGYEGPFLIVSGSVTGRVRSARMGAAFIQKPFDPMEVVESAEELIATGESASTRRAAR